MLAVCVASEDADDDDDAIDEETKAVDSRISGCHCVPSEQLKG